MGWSWRGVFDGVAQQVGQDLFDPGLVGEDVGQEAGEGDAEVAGGLGGTALLDRDVDQARDGLRFQVELDFVCVELGHLDGLLDEVVEAVGLLVDDGEQVASAPVHRGPAGRAAR